MSKKGKMGPKERESFKRFMEHMKARRQETIRDALQNPYENWMAEKLETTGDRWKRQVIQSTYILDFWCHKKGINVEVDGDSHNPTQDALRDRRLLRLGILVLRVPNGDEAAAAAVLNRIAQEGSWKQRKSALHLTSARAARANARKKGITDEASVSAYAQARNDKQFPDLIPRTGRAKILIPTRKSNPQ